MGKTLQKGRHVLLRFPRLSDCDEFQSLRRESGKFLEPWEPAPPEGIDPYSCAAFTRFCASADGERVKRFLACRTKDGAIVGSITLSEIVYGCFQSAYIGYWVGERYARRGYISDGVTLAIRYAFDILDLHRVEANIQPDNIASLALAKKCGFRKEGFSPGYLKIAGRWRDHERWTILRDRSPGVTR